MANATTETFRAIMCLKFSALNSSEHCLAFEHISCERELWLPSLYEKQAFSLLKNGIPSTNLDLPFLLSVRSFWSCSQANEIVD